MAKPAASLPNRLSKWPNPKEKSKKASLFVLHFILCAGVMAFGGLALQCYATQFYTSLILVSKANFSMKLPIDPEQ